MRRKSAPTPEPILALDLGSTSIRAALVVDGKPQVLHIVGTDAGLPCVAGIDGAAEPPTLTLGETARRLALTESRGQVFDLAELAGVRHELADLEGEHWRLVPVERGPGGDVHFRLAGESWPIPRLLGALIQSLREPLERQCSPLPSRVVVSVAPGSSDARRRAIVHAVEIAGFDEVELVAGTTAATVAWATLGREGPRALGIVALEDALAEAEAEASKDEADEPSDEASNEDADQADEPSEGEPETETEDAPEPDPEPEGPRESLFLVLDFGASSFDASLARGDDQGNLELLAARTSFELGGQRIDARIIDWLLGQFEDQNEVDLSSDPNVLARMRDVAQKAKVALSDAESHDLRLPYLWADASGSKHLFATLERERFERLIRDLVDAAAGLVEALLADAGVGVDEVDDIVMIGGSAQIPVVQDRIEALFGRVPETDLGTPALDLDFVVRGLALEASRRLQRRPKTQVSEVAGRELWVRAPGQAPARLNDRSTPLPFNRSVDIELGEGETHVDIYEGDEDDRELSTRVGLSQGRNRAVLHLALDTHGRLGFHAHPPTLIVAPRQRVGLSERALARFRHEAQTRAEASAAHRFAERLRTRLRSLAQTNTSWLEDKNKGIDDLLRTSLTSWGRDVEAAFEAGDEELLLLALEAFAELRDALPKKLREQLEELPPFVVPREPEEGEDDDGDGGAPEAVEPAFGADPDEDYGADDRVDVLEPQRADDDEELDGDDEDGDEPDEDVDEPDEPEDDGGAAMPDDEAPADAVPDDDGGNEVVPDDEAPADVVPDDEAPADMVPDDDGGQAVPEDDGGTDAEPEDDDGEAVPEDDGGTDAEPEDDGDREAVPEDDGGGEVVPDDDGGREAEPEDDGGDAESEDDGGGEVPEGDGGRDAEPED